MPTSDDEAHYHAHREAGVTALLILDPEAVGVEPVITDPARSSDPGLHRQALELVELGLELGPCVGGIMPVTGQPAGVHQLESVVRGDEHGHEMLRSELIDAIRVLVLDIVHDDPVEPFDAEASD